MIRLTAPVRTSRLLTGLLAADVGYLWFNLLSGGAIVVLHSAGFWVDFPAGATWALIRSLLLVYAHRFRYPPITLMLIGMELALGVLLSIADLWVYYSTECGCTLTSGGTVETLLVRLTVATVAIYLLR